MATFLVTTKMSPALRERVEKSVRGGRASSPRGMRRTISLARFALVLVVGFAIYTALSNRRREAEALAHERSELTALVKTAHASLDPRDLGAVPRASGWIDRLADRDHPFVEVVDDEVRGPGVLAARLAQPLVWVRGPIDGFAPTKLNDTAQSSAKDGLALCLVAPPPARTEAALYEAVRPAYGRRAGLEERTPNVRRLHEAIAGMPFLTSAFADRAVSAPDRAALRDLRREWDRAPIERAKLTARTRHLLVALDEPGDGTGPTELDGERSHFVRVALVDLDASKVLFATRRQVDPSWISKERRPSYAAGLDSCALAFDIHAATSGAKKAP